MNDDMRRLAARLRGWRQQFGSMAETPEARLALRELLRADEAACRSALGAVRAMTYEQMLSLLQQHGELNTPAGVEVDYAEQLVNAMCGPDSDLLLTDIDDYANMLKRVVEYAQYA